LYTHQIIINIQEVQVKIVFYPLYFTYRVAYVPLGRYKKPCGGELNGTF